MSVKHAVALFGLTLAVIGLSAPPALAEKHVVKCDGYLLSLKARKETAILVWGKGGSDKKNLQEEDDRRRRTIRILRGVRILPIHAVDDDA